ncbi:unnamed protein product, partial [Gulo gulo]
LASDRRSRHPGDSPRHPRFLGAEGSQGPPAPRVPPNQPSQAVKPPGHRADPSSSPCSGQLCDLGHSLRPPSVEGSQDPTPS